jgi:hypothetical protein
MVAAIKDAHWVLNITATVKKTFACRHAMLLPQGGVRRGH